jgi:short-subunit dehydrogenase involved in D-alanine esterification of teichoic acids
MDNIRLTEDILFSIQSLIEKFGGIDNTVIITGVSKASLTKFLNQQPRSKLLGM